MLDGCVEKKRTRTDNSFMNSDLRYDETAGKQEDLLRLGQYPR